MTARWFLTAILTAALALLIGTLWARESGQPGPLPSGGVALSVEGSLPSLGGATEWLNSPPLSAGALRGKVVLIEFWTYTCINWRRTLPYVHAWAKKYREHGLVVLGVHTPEFSFEGNPNNVRDATRELGIDYPVAVDTRHAIWGAFKNQYWPALYLVDAQGHIRYHQFGEGHYAETELAIQQLLTESGQLDFSHDLESLDPQGSEAAADWHNLKSPETYTGYELASGFASPGGVAADRARVYGIPSRLSLNEWALAGNWTVGREAAVLNSRGGRVVFRFHARDVNLIMAPFARGSSVRFRVRIDGQPPGALHGVDVDEQGNGVLVRPMMYQLIRAFPVADREAEIEFENPGVELFDFTFG